MHLVGKSLALGKLGGKVQGIHAKGMGSEARQSESDQRSKTAEQDVGEVARKKRNTV
jgi:hypothetical protein